ncbi:hypothetical protein ccbrp13_25300 [Ktedonobacteria bacterium brp13]|nr:hypothetical protein ccbrp13_25300 [Ktedonobacteria bacterium brp13]
MSKEEAGWEADFPKNTMPGHASFFTLSPILPVSGALVGRFSFALFVRLLSASPGTPLEITRNAFYDVLRDCLNLLGKQIALGYLALEAGWNNVANPGSSALTHGYEMVEALKGTFAKRAVPVVVA